MILSDRISIKHTHLYVYMYVYLYMHINILTNTHTHTSYTLIISDRISLTSLMASGTSSFCIFFLTWLSSLMASGTSSFWSWVRAWAHVCVYRCGAWADCIAG